MSQLKMRLVSLSILTLSLTAVGCGVGAEVEQPEPLPSESESASEHVVDEEVLYGGHEHDEGEVSAMASAAACAGFCNDECVAYARCRAPNLPYGLFTWADKRAIINSNHAHVGCVAMILGSNPAGHTAFVAKVNKTVNPYRITLNESNWGSRTCNTRTGTKGGLNITNYWCPRAAHTASCAGPM
ncbi:CHAP domain-containing protein [Myxococcus sp. AM001]|nr:CHAP domain-containing protein [Myxococcus sp. AM001]